MKKRIVAILLALSVLMSLAMLTGCNNNSGNSGNFVIPEGGCDGSEVTIRFDHTMNASYAEVLDRHIAEFNKLYPNIKVEHGQVGGYDDVRDNIAVQLTVGTQPNMAYCYQDHVALYNISKKVVSLDAFIDSTIEITRADGTTEILGLTDAQKADFIEGYYQEGKKFADGKMYTLPMSKSTEVLYYNKTFFEANNLTVPTTWDELEEVCKKIKEIDPKSIPLGYDSEANWFITMCEQLNSPYTSATGENFQFDNETNRQFVARFRDWYKKGYITTQKILGSYTSELFKSTSTVKSYMSIGSSAGATHQRPAKGADGNYPFEVGIATVPQADANNKKVISQGPSLCIFQSENPQEVVATWLFVKYLTTNVEFQAEFSITSGYVPVLKSVAQNEVYAAHLAKADGGDYITGLAAKVCLDQQDAYYTSPAFVGSSDARDAVGLLLQSALVDSNTDTNAVLDKVFKEALTSCREGM